MLTRRLIRRILIIPPAGLIGNWERELRTLFCLDFHIIGGSDSKAGNPFRGSNSDRLIVSVDTLAGDRTFARLQEPGVEPYDLCIFDEAHKLAADRQPDFSIRRTDRYRVAEALAGVPSGDPRWSLDWACHPLSTPSPSPPPHMEQAVSDQGAEEAIRRLEGMLTKEQVEALEARSAGFTGMVGM